MTEQTEAPEATPAGLPPEQEIDFAGRKLWVRMPSPEQLLVWKRTLTQLQSADVRSWNGVQVMKALERTRAIIDSLLVHDTDKEWLDDGLLAGTIGLKDTAQIINGTVDAFTLAAQEDGTVDAFTLAAQESGNRADRRAAKKAPAKKAARKAPGKKAAR